MRHGRQAERGSAMVIALLVMVVLSGLGAVVFTTASSNLQNAGRDRRAGGAMGLAEAGIAEALAYMRLHGVGSLTCEVTATSPPTYTGCDRKWGYNNPHTPSPPLGAGRQYQVWVQRLRKFSPTTGVKEGQYKITSVGTQEPGPGKRTISTEVTVKPHDFPLGVFSDQYIREAGNVTIDSESVFTKGCIGKRDNMTFTGTHDLAYPALVPAAHSAKYITTSNITVDNDPNCRPGDNNNIHRPFPGPGFCNPQQPPPKPDLRFDADSQGGDTAGTACEPGPSTGNRGLKSSHFDLAALSRDYGYVNPRGLPASQYEFLRQAAQAQGNYYDCTPTLNPIVPPGGLCASGGLVKFVKPDPEDNAVVYIKIDSTKTHTANSTDFSTPAPGYGESTCGTRSVLLVLEGGNLTMNSAVDLVGAVFVPDGTAQFNGSANLVGTVFAKSIFIAGGGNRIKLKQCFFDNMPGGLQVVSPSNFREIDR